MSGSEASGVNEGSWEGRLLELIGDICGLLDIEELRAGMLESLQRALPSDYVSLNDVGTSPEKVVTLMRPGEPAFMSEWAQLAHENPLLRHHRETLDGRAYRFSDVTTPDELHGLALYQRVYAPLGVEHQIAFTLPGSSERVLAIALSRGAEDYSDEERDFINSGRPFLIQAYLNAIAHADLRARAGADVASLLREALLGAGMTRREAEVLRLVAVGRSNRDVASELAISDRTVGKHLEHCFRKLGVGDRSSAAGRAWELAGGRSRAVADEAR